MVRKFRVQLLQLLESGNIDLCFANEDEAIELLRLLLIRIFGDILKYGAKIILFHP